jgi:hypothetical protein
MENLPEKRQQATAVAIAICNPPPGTKAIAIRRQMVELPEVAKALTPVEKYIFAASTKTQICEMDDGALVEKTAQMFRFIAMDVGFRIPTEQNDWAYMCTRLLDILKKYYSQMTLADIKLAFELATTGELNEFLPKDSQGNPDKNHYQQFNADYFAKILNAYRRKQNGTISKAYAALPEPKREISPEQKKQYHNETVERCRDTFLRYKYTGKYDAGMFGDMFIYNWLHAVGLADDVKETEDDRKTALSRYMQRVAAGWVNRYTAEHVRRDGTKSREIDYTAFEVARLKEIRNAFARMVAEELQVDNYLTYWKDEHNND